MIRNEKRHPWFLVVIASNIGFGGVVYRKRYQSKKAWVIVTDIIPSSQVQSNMFYQYDTEKQERIMLALDKINGLYGTDKLRLGSQGLVEIGNLKMKSYPHVTQPGLKISFISKYKHNINT